MIKYNKGGKETVDFRQLTYFTTVYETGNFTAAARKLHISQQGLSKSIQNLEREMDCILFERNKAGLRPTTLGTVFYDQAVQMIQLYEKSMKVMRQAKTAHRSLKIGFASSTFGALKEIDTALVRFTEMYPEISVEIFNETDYVCEEKIEKGELDVAFSMGNFSASDIEMDFLMKEMIYALVSEKHPLAKKRQLTIADLREESLITSDKNNKGYEILKADFQAKGFEPHIAFTTGDIQMHFRLTQKMLGISLLPAHLLTLLSDDYHLCAIPVTDLREREIYMFYKKDCKQSPDIKKLLAFCKALI